jgi:hypothetical protein
MVAPWRPQPRFQDRRYGPMSRPGCGRCGIRQRSPSLLPIPRGIQNARKRTKPARFREMMRNEMDWDPRGTPCPVSKKDLAGPLGGRPSLNREASRLGDVRVRRPSFRAQVPETDSGYLNPGNLPRCSIAWPSISRFTGLIATGNWFWLVCKNRNAVKLSQFVRDNSPQSQLNLPSATLRNRKSRKTLMRLEERSSSG